MAKRVYTGDAPAVAQKVRVTLDGTPGESADLVARIGRKVVTAQSLSERADDTFADLLQAMAHAWNESTIGEFAEVTASTGVLEDGTPYLELDADTPGVPFDVEFSAPYPTIDVDTVQQGGPGKNTVQRWFISPAPTGGVYRLAVDLGGGVETSEPIPAGADADAIRDAMVAGMPSLSLGDVTVTGTGTEDDPCEVEFRGAYASQSIPALSVDTSGLTGDATATLEVIQEGGEPVEDALIVRDTFTAADGTELSTHETDTGHAWQKVSGADLLIQNNRLVHDGVSTATYAVTTSHGADTVVKMQLVLSADAGPQQNYGVEIYIRSTQVDMTGDWLRVNVRKVAGSATFKVTIEEWRLGASTILATGTAEYVSGVPYSIAIRSGGDTIIVDTGVEQVIAYNASVAGGFYGLRMSRYGDHTPSIDSFEIHSSQESDEQWRLFTNAAAGTLTLTSPAGVSTGPIDHDAAAATIKSALESIYAGTWTVTGTGTSGDPWVATAGGAMAGTSITEPTIDDTLLSLGYLVDVATLQDGGGATDETWRVIVHDATGGTVRYEFRDRVTDPVPYNADASTVQAALEALTSIGAGNVTVTGSGTPADPYEITVHDALGGEDHPQLYVHNEGLTGPSSIIVTQETLQISRGPAHWDDPLNWIDPDTGEYGMPQTGDDVYIETGSNERSLRYGLDQSSVKLHSLRISSKFEQGAELGLAQFNEQGGYQEYRETHLRIGFQGDARIEIGAGDGGGSSRINLDTGTDPVTIRVLTTSGPPPDSLAAVNWRGDNTLNELIVIDGFVGVALNPGETAMLGELTLRDGLVALGDGATVGVGGTSLAVDKTGGELIVNRAFIDGVAVING